mmetsp:Transcript_38437/g.50648  ORF Transcript_38437/g.50648 Transcript_38437/m.50648 type:complete len:102 (+) Transcript_38437:445-750(+)
MLLVVVDLLVRHLLLLNNMNRPLKYKQRQMLAASTNKTSSTAFNKIRDKSHPARHFMMHSSNVSKTNHTQRSIESDHNLPKCLQNENVHNRENPPDLTCRS